MGKVQNTTNSYLLAQKTNKRLFDQATDQQMPLKPKKKTIIYKLKLPCFWGLHILLLFLGAKLRGNQSKLHYLNASAPQDLRNS